MEQALVEYERASFWRETAAALARQEAGDNDEDLWDRTVRDGLDRD